MHIVFLKCLEKLGAEVLFKLIELLLVGCFRREVDIFCQRKMKKEGSNIMNLKCFFFFQDISALVSKPQL